MGVCFRCRNAGMAKKFLDYPEIGAVLKQMRGETVAKHMRGYFSVNPCQGATFFYTPPQGARCESGAATR